jgi:AraC-like DNA-binding protein
MALGAVAGAPVNVATLRNESPRGCFTYWEWHPPELAGLVELIWQSEGTTTEDYDRHFPNGTLELLVNLGGERFELVEPEGAGTFRTTWLCGQLLGPIVTTQPRRHAVLGVRLRPAGAYALLSAPLRCLTHTVVELEDVVGGAARELVARCREATSVEARFRIAAVWLAERTAGARAVDPAIAWATMQIEAHGGDVPIAHLRRETGLSKTRLAAAFRDQIGISPKLYARIVRFRGTLAMVERGTGSLADVALAAGYYDQPHFNAEFRELTGWSPSEFLVARYPTGVPLLPGYR